MNMVVIGLLAAAFQVAGPYFDTTIVYRNTESGRPVYFHSSAGGWSFGDTHQSRPLEDCTDIDLEICLRDGRGFEIVFPSSESGNLPFSFTTEAYDYEISSIIQSFEYTDSASFVSLRQIEDGIVIRNFLFSDRCGLVAFVEFGEGAENHFVTRTCGFLVPSTRMPSPAQSD